MMREDERENDNVESNLRIYCQNVAKNTLHLDTVLVTLNGTFDVVFVQEPPWNTVRHAPSSSNKEGEAVTGAQMHPDWLYLARPPIRSLSYTDRRYTPVEEGRDGVYVVCSMLSKSIELWTTDLIM